MQNVRYNISPCTQQEATDFIGKIDMSVYLSRGIVRADERSHYDRYAFVRDDSKVAVVYDTSANVISITAPQNYADQLLELFGTEGRNVKRSTVPAQNSARRDDRYNRTVPVDGSPDTRARLFVSPDKIRARPEIKPTTLIFTSKGEELSTEEIFPPQRAKPRNQSNVAPRLRTSDSYERPDNGFTSRDGGYAKPDRNGYGRNDNSVWTPRDGGNYGRNDNNVFGNYGRDGVHVNASMPERQKAASVDEFFMRTEKQTAPTPTQRTPDMPKRATISFGDEDEDNGKTLPERPRSGGTGLYADIASRTQPQAPADEPIKRKRGRPRKETASADIVMPPEMRDKQQTKPSPRPENGGKSLPEARLTAMLKKRLPTAYEYLSEQSRIDFSYGLNDFSQNKLNLSDYSVLLVPPFRGLERLIFDLQSAEGIKVKMIGQAFDKDDSGRYILKHGYCQRIGSVIYAEVLVALYTEYFSRRNFFAHSDNSEDNRSRAIPDRAEAKSIFDNLLNVVEYNAKKLKEIGFSMSIGDVK